MDQLQLLYAAADAEHARAELTNSNVVAAAMGAAMSKEGGRFLKELQIRLSKMAQSDPFGSQAPDEDEVQERAKPKPRRHK